MKTFKAFLAAFLLTFQPLAWSAITPHELQIYQAGSASSYTTPSFSITNNALVIVSIAGRGPTAPVVSDLTGHGLVWREDAAIPFSSIRAFHIWCAQGTSTGADGLQVDFTGTITSVQIFVHEFRGVAVDTDCRNVLGNHVSATAQLTDGNSITCETLSPFVGPDSATFSSVAGKDNFTDLVTEAGVFEELIDQGHIDTRMVVSWLDGEQNSVNTVVSSDGNYHDIGCYANEIKAGAAVAPRVVIYRRKGR